MLKSKSLKTVGCMLLALSMLLVSGCSDNSKKSGKNVSASDVIIYEVPDDEAEDTDEDAAEVEYSPSLFYNYWNSNLLPKYGTAKAVKLEISENLYSAVTGSASVSICDVDGDGQDEMLHVFLGKYADSTDAMILEVYEFAKNKVKRTASAVVDEHFTFFGNGSASLFLSQKDDQWYICCEEFGDFLGEARTTEYLILQYDGESLKHCKSIVDPGYTAERALFADYEGKSFRRDKNGVSVFRTDYDNWEEIYAENYDEEGTYIKDRNVYVKGKYLDYQKAMKIELEEYGLSLRFSGGFNLGAKQDGKTVSRICRLVLSYTDNADSVSTKAVLCDYTGCLYHIDKSGFKKLTVDSDLQYNLNIYLSNFAEVDLPSFKGMPETNALIDFGVHHNIKNNFAKTVDLKVTDDYNYRMSTKHIADKIYKYFFVRTDESDYSLFAKNDNWMTYKKGYLYCNDVAEGSPWGDFAVVSKAESIGDNLYKITFCNYDINAFYDKQTGDSKPYTLTPDDVKKLKFQKHKDGTALIYAADLTKRSTYRLLAYNLK